MRGWTLYGGEPGEIRPDVLLVGPSLEASAKLICEADLVADSGKFGKRAFVKVCDLKMLDSVITDTNLSPEYRDMLAERGLNVVFAEIRNRS